jgi:farnesyl-diphosphate farnesyltransferase
LALLQTLSAADLKLVREVLTTITSGQEMDLRRFGQMAKSGASATGQQIIALETAAELDDYTYRVAGCVGEFWTKICRAHLFPDARLDEKQFIMDGIRFGKGLQLVNILRDLPADLKNGRCYLPTQRLDEAKLWPEVLLSPVNGQKFLPLFHDYLDKAEAHLAAGWRYTNTLPFGQFRVRFACAWPVLIGIRTIEKLRAASVMELQQRVKVSRGEVRGIIFRSVLCSPLASTWRQLYSPTVKAVDSAGKLA